VRGITFTPSNQRILLLALSDRNLQLIKFTTRAIVYAEFCGNFYRATLSPGVRPSIRPSVTLVDYIQKAKDIVKLLSTPGSVTILVFDPQHRYPIPRGTPSAGAQNTSPGC